MRIQCYNCRKLFMESKIIQVYHSESLASINWIYLCEKCYQDRIKKNQMERDKEIKEKKAREKFREDYPLLWKILIFFWGFGVFASVWLILVMLLRGSL